MEIKWLGHSCFRIKTKNTTIITDPYSPDYGYTLGKQTADIVTISHQHSDHNYLEGIGGEARAIKGPGEYEIKDAIIIGIASYHDNQKGELRGKNTIYVVEVDGISLCHLGDIGHLPTDDQLDEIGSVDVLFIPVGGNYTVDAQAAAQIVRKIEPRIILPMHYKTDDCTLDMDEVDKFLKEMGAENITPKPKLSVTKNNLPLSMEVQLLEY